MLVSSRLARRCAPRNDRKGANMPEKRTVTVYIDYKSPYAYLAKDLVYELARDFAVRVDWLPYVLDIPSFLGSARLYAKRQGVAVLRQYHDITFARFWKRELDIEDPSVIAAVLAEAGAETAGFAAYAAGEGPREVDRLSRAAEETGIFGVPTFVVDGEQFWGSEHLPDIREMLGR